MSENLKDKGMAAVASYLELRGYEVLRDCWECDGCEPIIVAVDEGTLVFVEVTVSGSVWGGMSPADVSDEDRRRCENAMLRYLSENEEGTMPLRFDKAVIMPIRPNRGFLRHHVNVLM